MATVDVLTDALPVLRQHSYPATFFIVGRATEEGYEFWWDAIERLFLSEQALPSVVILDLPECRIRQSTVGRDRLIAHDMVRDALYQVSANVRDVAVRELFEWAKGLP